MVFLFAPGPKLKSKRNLGKKHWLFTGFVGDELLPNDSTPTQEIA